MRFIKENQLMWNSHLKNLMENYDFGVDSSDSGSNPIEDFEDSEVVLSFEPEAPIEIDDGYEEERIDIALYTDIKKLSEYSDRLLKMAKETEFEPWMAAQLSKASSYVSDVWHRLDAKVDFANTGVEQSDNINI